MRSRYLQLIALSFLFLYVSTASAPKAESGSFIFGSSDDGPPAVDLPLPSRNYDPESYRLALEKSKGQCESTRCQWWHDYVLGLSVMNTDAPQACKIFSDLADESKFSLQPIAAIHQAELCSQDPKKAAEILKFLKKYLADQKPALWLQGEMTVAAVKAAHQAQSPEEFDLILKAATLLKSRKTKVQLLQEGIADATKLKDAKTTDLQSELYKLAPRLSQTNNEDWWAVGMDAMAAHDYDVAIKAFKKVVRQTQYSVPIRRSAYDYLKLSYKAIQDKGSALKIAKKLFQWDLAMMKNKKHAAEASRHVLSSGLSLARFVWTEHKSQEALGLLTKIQNVIRNPASLSDVFFVRARIDEELVKMQDALASMDKAIATAPDAGTKSIYKWGYAWLNYKLGHYDQARVTLEDLVKNETDPVKRAQQNFWLAKTYAQLNLKDQARALWQEVTQEDPLSYYALISYRELGEPLPPVGDIDTAQLSRVPRKLASEDPKANPQFDWLVSVGELRMARELLEEEEPIPDTTLESGDAIFRDYARAHDFAPIFAHVFKLSAAEQQALFAEHPEFIFPKSYEDFVSDGAARSGLWPEYIFSIMRQESSFDPLAVSGADAYGLLQILPSIAKQVGARTGVAVSGKDDLLDPHTNILLGTQHLRQYWEKFDGQFILTTAAYNASPEAVKGWVETRYHGDPLIFIEDIPYEETRIYVKLVLRNFIDYLRLDSGGSSIPFPEWCLEGIQASKD